MNRYLKETPRDEPWNPVAQDMKGKAEPQEAAKTIKELEMEMSLYRRP